MHDQSKLADQVLQNSPSPPPQKKKNCLRDDNHLQQYLLLIRNIISICVAVYTSAAPDYLDV